MPEKIFRDIKENQTDEVVNYILSVMPETGIITFTGDLGAGKTTLVKKLVKAMGSLDAATSPTFALVNEYRTAKGKKIYHSDWYRIQNAEELYNAGIEEYLELPESLLLVEWPEIGEEILSGYPRIKINIEHLNSGRNYSLLY